MKQPVCCLTYCFPCCSAYYTRYKALDGDLTRYVCCQGYSDCMCFKAGQCYEQSCPAFCLGVESCCCVGPGMSSSREFVMDQYSLRPDACDNRIIRLTNCLQVLSCVCDILAIFMSQLRDLAHLIHSVAQIVFYTTLGCMAAQVNYELDSRKGEMGDAYTSIPTGDLIPELDRESDVLLKEKDVNMV